MERSLILMAIWLTFSTWTALVIAAVALMLWQALIKLLRLVAEFSRYLRDRHTISELAHFKIRLFGIAGYAGTALAAGWLTLALSFEPSTLGSIWNSNHRAPILTSTAAAAFTMVLIMAAAILISAAARQVALHRLICRGVLLPVSTNARLNHLAIEQNRQVVRYAGYRPFIGSGEEVATWSLALRLLAVSGGTNQVLPHEGQREFDDFAFGSEELIRRIRTELEQLADPTGAETQLPGLTVEDRVFVADSYLHFLPPDLEDAVSEARTNPTGPARHYLACTVVGWSGEIVTSIFINASLQGRTLYLDFSVWALLPTRPDFHVLAKSGQQLAGWHIKQLFRRLPTLPDEILRVFPVSRRRDLHLRYLLGIAGDRTAGVAKRGSDYAVREDGAITRRVAAVAAAGPSVRLTERHKDVLEIVESDTATERAALNAVREAERVTDQAARAVNYFQIRDIQRHWKILERRVIAAVVDFLEDNDIDVSEFSSRAVNILNNNGTIFTGTVNATNSQLGTGTVVNQATPSS